MTELGGPTTQSGILYQNTLAALYLGRLCHGDVNPPHEQIVEVRCEAPTDVDDIVLVFGDGHREFVQAKEALDMAGIPWDRLWRSFAQQYSTVPFDFARDRLLLFVGEPRPEWRMLLGIAQRADGSLCFAEWQARLTKEQKRLLTKIQAVLQPAGLEPEEQRALLSRVDIRQEPMEDLELRAYRELPPCNVRPATLFRLLRDRVGPHARLRKAFRRDVLLASLQSEDEIVFKDPLPSTGPNLQGPLSFLPEDRSRLLWFVSSRLKNGCLQSEREAVIEAISETQFVAPWAWERDVPAGNVPYQEACLHFAARSDGLVLILEGEITTFCRREYEAAFSAKKPCYIFVKDGNALSRPAKGFLDEQRKRGSNPVRFQSSTELKSLLIKSLQSECVRAFRKAQHLMLSAPPIQARFP